MRGGGGGGEFRTNRQRAFGEPDEDEESSELLGERTIRGRVRRGPGAGGLWMDVGAVEDELSLGSTSMDESSCEDTVPMDAGAGAVCSGRGWCCEGDCPAVA